MRLVFAGTPAVALPALQALADSPHELLAVLTRPDAASGRGRTVTRSPVAAWADEHDVPVLSPARVNEPEFLAVLSDLAPDCVPVVAYGALVGLAALTIPTHGWVNLHFSLLPAWRGAAPVQHAVMAGDDFTGASTFQLEQGLDTGPVYGTMTERIRARDTAGDLLERLSIGGAQLLLATLDGIATGALAALPQSPDGVSLAPKLTGAQAHLNWDTPTRGIDRLIRGLTPAPGAWSLFRGERLGLGPVLPLDQDAAQELRCTAQTPEPEASDPGAGTIVVSRRAVHVFTRDGAVELHEVRPAGKRAMSALDWARGARPDSGEQLS